MDRNQLIKLLSANPKFKSVDVGLILDLFTGKISLKKFDEKTILAINELKKIIRKKRNKLRTPIFPIGGFPIMGGIQQNGCCNGNHPMYIPQSQPSIIVLPPQQAPALYYPPPQYNSVGNVSIDPSMFREMANDIKEYIYNQTSNYKKAYEQNMKYISNEFANINSRLGITPTDQYYQNQNQQYQPYQQYQQYQPYAPQQQVNNQNSDNNPMN